MLESGQNDPEGSFFRILDIRAGRTATTTPYAHPRSGIYHLKLRADPSSRGAKGLLRGKIWHRTASVTYQS